MRQKKKGGIKPIAVIDEASLSTLKDWQTINKFNDEDGAIVFAIYGNAQVHNSIGTEPISLDYFIKNGFHVYEQAYS